MDKYRQDLDTFREMFTLFKNSSAREATILKEYEAKFITNKGKEIFAEFRKDYGGIVPKIPIIGESAQVKAATKAIDKLYFNASILTHLPDVREQFARSEAKALVEGLIHPEIAGNLEQRGLLDKFNSLTDENRILIKSNEELKGKLATAEHKLQQMTGFYKNLSEQIIIRFKLSPEEVQKMAQTKVIIPSQDKAQQQKSVRKNDLSI